VSLISVSVLAGESVPLSSLYAKSKVGGFDVTYLNSQDTFHDTKNVDDVTPFYEAYDYDTFDPDSAQGSCYKEQTQQLMAFFKAKGTGTTLKKLSVKHFVVKAYEVVEDKRYPFEINQDVSGLKNYNGFEAGNGTYYISFRVDKGACNKIQTKDDIIAGFALASKQAQQKKSGKVADNTDILGLKGPLTTALNSLNGAPRNPGSPVTRVKKKMVPASSSAQPSQNWSLVNKSTNAGSGQ
jgi:hypothetical protein